MAVRADPIGPVYDSGGSATLGATTAGVAGPDVQVGMFWACLPAAAAASVTMRWGADGGIEMIAGNTYGPFPWSNLNLLTFDAASGTVTVNLMYAK